MLLPMLSEDREDSPRRLPLHRGGGRLLPEMVSSIASVAVNGASYRLCGIPRKMPSIIVCAVQSVGPVWIRHEQPKGARSDDDHREHEKRKMPGMSPVGTTKRRLVEKNQDPGRWFFFREIFSPRFATTVLRDGPCSTWLRCFSPNIKPRLKSVFRPLNSRWSPRARIGQAYLADHSANLESDPWAGRFRTRLTSSHVSTAGLPCDSRR